MNVSESYFASLLEESPFRPEEVRTAEAAERPSLEAVAPAAHSWYAEDLIVVGADAPEPPDLGGLFYSGKRHVVSGQDDSGKSWLLLAIAADELRADRGVIWVDTDFMGASMALERLRALDVEDERISRLFAYLQPGEALTDSACDYVVSLVDDLGVRLVAIDAFNAALSLHGYSPQSTKEVEAFFGRVVAPFQRAGAAVVLPDHVVKNKENRGRYAYGSERKSTGVDLHLGMTPIEPFGRGQRGRSKLTVHRDRVGFLEKPSPGLFVLDSDPETGRCSWRLEPEQGVSDEGQWRPTGLMEKVSRYLELAGEPRSRNQIEQSVKGKTDYKRQAIDALIDEGYAVEVQSGQTRLVQFEQTFRESNET